MNSRTHNRVGALAIVWMLAAGGCAPRDAVQVQLESVPTEPGDLIGLRIRAQVTGPPRDLHYKWYSVTGECEPQQTDNPATMFRFAEGVTSDRVSVEVWRGDERVAQSEIDVALDERVRRLSTRPLPAIQVEFTEVPPYQPNGGTETHANISGRVTGDLSGEYQVLVYARADAWYIQPEANAAHAIGAGNRWSTWTHTGSSYAVLVVRPGADAFTRLDVLPQVGGNVMARAIVEGKRR